ncbi:hypothetical protein Q0M94_03480 [Deinococcus radiomollis]|uniref:hypothetical protein n=1 Tax=Deinococcus radiomollis TaxID=468916 RepID=UPI003891A252
MLTAARNTKKWGTDAFPETISLLVAANTKIFKGSLVVLNAGYLVPGTTSTTVIAMGRAEATVDNTNGAAGALSIDVRRGLFNWASATGADLITQASVGQTAYVVDDQTVGLTSGGGTRSKAGLILYVDQYGVWVETNGHQ